MAVNHLFLLGGVIGLLLVVGLGVFAGSFAEYYAVQYHHPTLHTFAFLASFAAATIAAYVHQLLYVTYTSASFSLYSPFIFGLCVMAIQQLLFSGPWAESRLLKFEYGDEWVDHIGERVEP